ncbi:MAG: hypothetical protein ABUK01_09365 [Leptospirales bacterium]
MNESEVQPVSVSVVKEADLFAYNTPIKEGKTMDKPPLFVYTTLESFYFIKNNVQINRGLSKTRNITTN